MAFDITRKRARDTADIPLKNGDGTPLTDDQGNELSVTISGPGSKIWKQADAERSRRRTKRINDSGKLTAAMDDKEKDEIDFLCAVTVKFNGDIAHPDAEKKGDLPRAIYSDDALGFIRDQVGAEAGSWTAFTKGSATD